MATDMDTVPIEQLFPRRQAESGGICRTGCFSGSVGGLSSQTSRPDSRIPRPETSIDQRPEPGRRQTWDLLKHRTGWRPCVACHESANRSQRQVRQKNNSTVVTAENRLSREIRPRCCEFWPVFHCRLTLDPRLPDQSMGCGLQQSNRSLTHGFRKSGGHGAEASAGSGCAFGQHCGSAGAASRSRMCSPTRSALAMMVSAGFTAPLDGKKLESTT
jgi:hypothetical protein